MELPAVRMASFIFGISISAVKIECTFSDFKSDQESDWEQHDGPIQVYHPRTDTQYTCIYGQARNQIEQAHFLIRQVAK